MEKPTNYPKVYFVGGVNGVGKSTLLTEISIRYPEFRIIKGSSLFMEWLGVTPGDYNSLRSLPDYYKISEFNKMMDNLLSKQVLDERVMLVDAHYFHYKRGEMIDTTGDWMSSLNALFVITGEVEEIFKRVLEDTKDRDLFPRGTSRYEQKELLRIYLEGTNQKAQEISNRYRIPLFTINNIQGNINKVVDYFLVAHTNIINK
ncbi:MAG: AAA family ATPase [Candidatus Paceibacterota bacterium]